MVQYVDTLSGLVPQSDEVWPASMKKKALLFCLLLVAVPLCANAIADYRRFRQAMDLRVGAALPIPNLWLSSIASVAFAWLAGASWRRRQPTSAPHSDTIPKKASPDDC